MDARTTSAPPLRDKILHVESLRFSGFNMDRKRGVDPIFRRNFGGSSGDPRFLAVFDILGPLAAWKGVLNSVTDCMRGVDFASLWAILALTLGRWPLFDILAQLKNSKGPFTLLSHRG